MNEIISLIIPTYNEAENIIPLIDAVLDVLHNKKYPAEIIVVDDDSPDGTWRLVKELADRNDSCVKLLRRLKKRGLSSAVLDGFKMAKGTILGVMDADFSHPPSKLPKLIDPLIRSTADVTLGSRYAKGGKILNWPLRRQFTSRIATLLARALVPVKDPMSGFIFIKKEVIDGMILNPIGFKIGLEIIAKGKYKTIIEIPITFKDRRYGKSKLGSRVGFDYLIQLIQLFFTRRNNVLPLKKYKLKSSFGVCFTERSSGLKPQN